MTFAETLKQLRKQYKYSQYTLAKILRIAPSTLSMYEIGMRMPNYQILMEMADLFYVTTDYLLGHEELREKKVSYETGIPEEWARLREFFTWADGILSPAEWEDLLELMETYVNQVARRRNGQGSDKK